MKYRSTRNTRIERLWVEVGTQFVRAWRAFFHRLERLHRLDRGQKGHLWLLHRLFLDAINQDCASFQEEWNHHPIAGLGHDQTPEDMFFLSQLEHGEYPEPSNIHPTTVREYGVGVNTQQRVATDVSQQIHHDAVAVPDADSPFTSEMATSAFDQALGPALQSGTIPPGFFLLPTEWNAMPYPTSEPIRIARKDVDIPLPFDIWYPRAVRWAQGLTLMALVQEHVVG
ncbi:hypothetical protein FA13DRAFT_1647973 [Coprinellus micaceus]|uniref:Integrase core domain-containing protein n=1 Tax=Coprinellus micaceus TaxID=71717 RepID=A0A4Y7SB24_COPMI|nr:hypothetical protein FA13DRAFT_1647973 [Coprinellus micaceus]